MWRTILSIVAGLVGWGVVVTLLNFGLRAGIPGYHAAEATLVFTPAMKAGRLIEAALASLAAGMIVGAVAPGSRWAPWIVGLVLLAAFVPEHVRLWSRFPIWYHLSFLIPLAPLIAIGAALPARFRTAEGTQPRPSPVA
jgi:hypothetical protein